LEELDPAYLEFAAIERRSGVSKGPVSRPSGLGNAQREERPRQTNTASKFVPKRPKSNFVSVSNANAANFQGDDTSSLKAGMQVEHARFGPGKVTNIEGPSDNKKATIFFKNVGQKQLLLKFAKLKIVG
jgi:DNA helicase-2/ATP-dependent DNA helicase PcrA